MIVLASLCANPARGAAAGPPPEDFKHVILIVIDTLRADHLKCYGYKRRTSPNIDALARESLFCANAFAQSSWTRPSTASILTGLYPDKHTARDIDDSLPEEVVMLSEILRKESFRTAAFIANGNCGARVGFRQGYDTFKQYYSDKKNPNLNTRSDVITEDILGYLESVDPGQRQFIYVHYNDPHIPYYPKELIFAKNNTQVYPFSFFEGGWVERARKDSKMLEELINAYDDEILFVDKMIGRVFRALKDRGLYETSAIIVTSDHGESFLEHGDMGHGQYLYDEVIRVPLIIKIPGAFTGDVPGVVELVDIVPTLLEALRMDIPRNLDGEVIFVKKKDYALSELDRRDRHYFSARTLDKKLIIVNPGTAEEKRRFFFLDSDPEEKVNRYTSRFREADYRRMFSVFQEYNQAALSGGSGGVVYTPEELDSLRALGYAV